MTHPDTGELSSLIINTLGSYELKKEMRGGGGGCESDLMSTPLKAPPSPRLSHPHLCLIYLLFLYLLDT